VLLHVLENLDKTERLNDFTDVCVFDVTAAANLKWITRVGIHTSRETLGCECPTLLTLFRYLMDIAYQCIVEVVIDDNRCIIIGSSRFERYIVGKNTLMHPAHKRK